MKEYKLVKDLTAGKFYAGGKIFVKLNPSDATKRAVLFEKINQINKKNVLTKLDLNSSYVSEDSFKAKLMGTFLDLSQSQNPTTIDNVKKDADVFLNKMLPEDVMIFLPSSGINSNELHDLETNCIIYFELNEGFNLGFVIDKTFFEIVSAGGAK